MSNSSVWPIDRILSGAITPSQSGPGSDGNERVLGIPQILTITVASSSDCFVSYQDARWNGVLSLCRDAVGIFYSPSRQGWDLTDKMKRSFFQAAVTSILLYGCTTRMLTKRLEKKLDGNYTRMLRAILNKPWRQHPTRHQLYGHLPPITKTIQVRRTRHAGHCWRSRDELIRDVLLWTPTHGRAKAGRPARTYIQQLCEDTGCCPEDLPRAMNDREEWRERVRDIRATSAIWWWWSWYIYICLCARSPINIFRP